MITIYSLKQPDDIKVLFPDDKELYEKILSIREKTNERSKFGNRVNISQYDDSNKSSNFNKTQLKDNIVIKEIKSKYKF